MSGISESHEAGMGKVQIRNNMIRFAVAQAFGSANSVIVYATGAIVGDMLAPNKALATFPISVFVVGMAACTLPIGAIARRHGRQAAFRTGTVAGMTSGLIAALAVLLGSFWLFSAAMFLGGAYAAAVLSFRFAAADCVPQEQRARALSIVMIGGVFAGVLGPQIVTHTMKLLPPYLFLASYLAMAALAVLCGLILSGISIPKLANENSGSGRPLIEIVRQRKFVAAIICGVISYLLMNFIMTAAPLAMKICGLSLESSALGLQWHVIAMYAPSLFTGSLITRFGAGRIVLAGLALTVCSIATGLAGITQAHFWTLLILLGLGWNFAFLGASSLVLECYRPAERTRVQAFNDFVVFGFVAIGSFISGGLLETYGWTMVCWVALPPLFIAAISLAATGTFRRKVHEHLDALDPLMADAVPSDQR
ncbi:MAG: MFS transporter [Rhizomicrobium sp.]